MSATTDHTTSTLCQRAVLLALEHLQGIHTQTTELQALLIGMDCLPADVASDALRLLCRLDNELADLVQRIGEAGPG